MFVAKPEGQSGDVIVTLCIISFSGFLMVWYGVNSKSTVSLVLGIILLICATCGLPGMFLSVRHFRRKRKKRRLAIYAEKTARANKNSFTNNTVILEEERITVS